MHGVVNCRREVLSTEARQRYSELHAQLKASQDNLRSAAYNVSSLQQQQRTVRHHVRIGKAPHRLGLDMRRPENQGKAASEPPAYQPDVAGHDYTWHVSKHPFVLRFILGINSSAYPDPLPPACCKICAKMEFRGQALMWPSMMQHRLSVRWKGQRWAWPTQRLKARALSANWRPHWMSWSA